MAKTGKPLPKMKSSDLKKGERVPSVKPKGPLPPKPDPPERHPDGPDRPRGKTASLKMAQDAAFGNGTRKKGEQLAHILLMPGVELDEFITACRNPYHVKWTVTD